MDDMKYIVYMLVWSKKNFYFEFTTFLEGQDALRYTTIVAATLLKVLLYNNGSLYWLCIAEYFRDNGKHA